MKCYRQLFEHRLNNKKNLTDNQTDNQKRQMMYIHSQNRHRPNDHLSQSHYRKHRRLHTSHLHRRHKNSQKHFRLDRTYQCQQIESTKIYHPLFVKHFLQNDQSQQYKSQLYYYSIRLHRIILRHIPQDLHWQKLLQHLRHHQQQ